MTYVLAAYTVVALVLTLYEMRLWDELCRGRSKRQRPSSDGHSAD